MSDQYVKFLASQAGGFTSSQNVVDVELPGGQMWDLNDSYLQVYATVTATDAGAGSGTGVYSPELVFSGSNLHFPNSSLVKNCSLKTDAKGQLESIRRVDVLSQIKQQVFRSQRQEASGAFMSANSIADPKGNVHYSPFLDVRKEGTEYSALRTVPLPIRLADLMDSCATTRFDGRRMGAAHFRFELHAPTTIEARQTIPAATAGYSWINLTNIAAAGGGGEQTNVFTTQVGTANIRVIPSLAEIPLYVGMKIQISATNSVTGAVTGVSVINTLTWDETAGQMTITIDNVATLDRAAGEQLTDITISEITQPDALTVTFDRVELVAKRVGNPGPSMEMALPYRTWATIQDVGPVGVTEFQRQYSLAPECDGVLITFPGAVTPWSQNADIASYRLRLNQQDLTDRDVTIRSPLFYDRVSATMDAFGMATRNLRLNGGDSSAATYALSYPVGSDQVLIASPLPQTYGSKDLQVNVSLNGNQIDQLVAFQSLPRTVIY